MISTIKIVSVLLLLGLFLYASSLLSRKKHVEPELLRKIVHSGLGLTCLSFPWIFQHTWELIVLCIGVTSLLIAIRTIPYLQEKMGLGLYSVNRSSFGDLLFGITVVLLFHFSAQRHALYLLPLLILTLSDTAAALVGTRFGKHVFQVVSGWKSWEGSFAFFAVTAILSYLILTIFTSLNPLQIICITLMLSLIGTMVEAVSWHGLDNLFVPVGLFLLLKSLMTKMALELSITLLILIVLILAARKLSRYSQLNTHALLGALLAAYFFWEVGGLIWLLAPVIVFSIHVILACLQNDANEYGIDSVIGVVSTGIFWIFIAQQNLLPYAYYLFSLSMAINLQILVLLRIKYQTGSSSKYPLIILVALVSGWVFLPTLLSQYPASPQNLSIFLSGFFIMALGGILFRVRTRNTSLNRWVLQGIYVTAGSLVGLIPVLVIAK